MAAGPVPSSAVETESRLRAIEALVRDEVGTVHDGRLSQQSLDGQYATAAAVDPYARFRLKLRTDAANAKIVLLGDSTSMEANYPVYFTTLRSLTKVGGPLEGMADANIISGGNNGENAASWNTGADFGYSLAELTADAPDLVVYSFGINDVRVGTIDAATLISRIDTSISVIQAALPDADIMLRMPNNIRGEGGLLLNGITAQDATDIMYEAYIYFIDRYPNVGVLDTQSTIFGRVAGTSSVYMADQLHPNNPGQFLVAKAIAEAAGNGKVWGIGPVPGALPYHHVEIIKPTGAGNGYIDFGATAEYGRAAGTEVSIQAGDILHFEGYGIVDLTGATFVNTGGTSVRILKTGDWTTLANRFATLLTTRPPGIQRGRYWVTVDPAEVAAGAFGTATATITGAITENGVIAQPPTSFSSLELVWNVYVSAANTVTIRYYNPTASPINPASGSWRFWIAY